jgi:hypothetical protein
MEYRTATATGGYIHKEIQQQVSSTPEYGGDCALQGPDGVASSLKRLEDVTSSLFAYTLELQSVFGISVPQCANKGEQVSGIKPVIDRSVTTSTAALENLLQILNHLRS